MYKVNFESLLMKIFISLIALFNVLLSCSCSSRISYENKIYKITLKQKSNIIVGFIISNKETNSKLAFTPSLIMIDGEIPEGSLRSDYNSTDETVLYQCDSTYCIDTDSISIAFALEVLNHKRLDLLIYNSQLQDYKDENCTLLKQSK